MNRSGAAAVLLVMVSSCQGRSVRAPRVYPPPVTTPVFRVLGDLAGATVVERPASLSAPDGPSYRLRFVLEPSPAAVALRAVQMEIWPQEGPPSAYWESAYAVGDGGTILRRTATGPWQRLDSGTREDLNALGGNGRLLAVGDHGTVLRLVADGTWIREPTPVTVALRAVLSVYVAGDGGTLIERDDLGQWTVVPTHTTANLRGLWSHTDSDPRSHGGSLSGLYAVGDGGTIVHCALRMHPPVCVPRPSPTSEDLLAIRGGDEGRAFAAVHGPAFPPHLVVVTMSSGGFLEPEKGFEPLDWRVVSMRGSAPFFALARNGFMLYVGPRWTWAEPMAVGARGTAALVTGAGLVPIALPTHRDLYGADAQMLDVFAVGEAGTIVHGVIQGAALPVAIEE